MRITEEHIFHDEDASGYDIRVDASELGVPPGQCPPQDVVLTGLPAGRPCLFSLAGRTEYMMGDRTEFQYWSYWSDDLKLAVNLKVFND